MNRVVLVFFILLFTSATLNAETFRESSAFVQLKEKISAQNTEGAWQLAVKLEVEFLGDPDFDFLYGLAALKVQENERAVYAFERVVANKPKWLDAQYYLANAYYTMKNYHAAIDITQSMKQIDNIPAQLKSSVITLEKRATSALEQQSLYLAQSVNMSLGHDSNINAGSSKDTIFLPLLNQDIVLSDSSKEISDGYVSLGYQLMASKALTQSSKLVFSGAGRLHYFTKESDYNRFLISANLQYKKDFEAVSANVGFRVLPLWLNDSGFNTGNDIDGDSKNGNYYRTQYGATAGLNKALNEQWFIATDAFIGKTKNDTNDLLTTDDASFQVSTQYINARWRHAVSLAYSKAESTSVESQHNDSSTNAFNYMVNFALDSNWLASANISYQHQAYQNDHPFFFEKRVDKMWMFGTAIQYQYTDRWSYRLSANIQDKDSNLALFSYQRADINLSARMSF